MTKDESAQITIPVTATELDTLTNDAKAAGATLPCHCRSLLGLPLEIGAPEPATTADFTNSLTALLREESAGHEAAVAQLKRPPNTDDAELDDALRVLRIAVSAARAFAVDARLAISAIENDSE